MEHYYPFPMGRETGGRAKGNNDGWHYHKFLSLRANLSVAWDCPVQTVLYAYTANSRSWHIAANSKHYQETVRSWIRSSTPFGLKIEIVLSAGRVVTCWLEQQDMGIIQLSLANEMVRLYWLTTLHHWKSYVPIHRTLQTCRGPKEEQQDRTRGDLLYQDGHHTSMKEDYLSFCPCLHFNYISRCRLT